MVIQNTRESAVRREEFHTELRHWLNDSFETTIGDPETFGGKPWLWVRHGGDHFYLDADSSRDGVRRYLRIVDEQEGNPDWTMVPVEPGIRERVAIGRERETVIGFFFFHHLTLR